MTGDAKRSYQRAGFQESPVDPMNDRECRHREGARNGVGRAAEADAAR
jgi:hypothetical protein